MAKVAAPNKHYNGPGPGGAVFEDGVADVTDDAALNYYRGAGYTVDGETSQESAPDPVDPRDVEHEMFGSPLRDAAVDPQPGDFLAPINAGEANPHGPTVVSPELHASGGPAGIATGPVADDLGKQEAREREFADLRLRQAADANAVVEATEDLEDRGALGLSDPGSAEAGAVEQVEPPKGNASREEWVAYALSQGATDAELTELGRDEIRDRYAPKD